MLLFLIFLSFAIIFFISRKELCHSYSQNNLSLSRLNLKVVWLHISYRTDLENSARWLDDKIQFCKENRGDSCTRKSILQRIWGRSLKRRKCFAPEEGSPEAFPLSRVLRRNLLPSANLSSPPFSPLWDSFRMLVLFASFLSSIFMFGCQRSLDREISALHLSCPLGANSDFALWTWMQMIHPQCVKIVFICINLILIILYICL